jgi:DNA-binding MarR family transcriptional regulator
MSAKSSTRQSRAPSPSNNDQLGRRFSTAVVLFHAAIAARMNLNVTDWKCGELIDRIGPMNPGRLSELTGLSSAATTLVLDRLEASGFVRRERDPNDRRKVIIEPVRDATRDAKTQKLFAPMNDRIEALMSRYTPEQLEGIGDFLAEATQLIEEEALKLRQHAD